MTKSELIQHIADLNPHLYHRDVERIVTTIFDEISEALAKGDRVELRGYGAFNVKRREARAGRNTRTGAAARVWVKNVTFFKPGTTASQRPKSGWQDWCASRRNGRRREGGGGGAERGQGG